MFTTKYFEVGGECRGYTVDGVARGGGIRWVTSSPSGDVDMLGCLVTGIAALHLSTCRPVVRDRPQVVSQRTDEKAASRPKIGPKNQNNPTIPPHN